MEQKITEEQIEKAKEIYQKIDCWSEGKDLNKVLRERERKTKIKTEDWKKRKYGDRRGIGGISRTHIDKNKRLAEILSRCHIGFSKNSINITIEEEKSLNSIGSIKDALDSLDNCIKLSKEYLDEVKVTNTLSGTKWAVYFMFYKDEGKKHNEGLIGRAIIDVKGDGDDKNCVEFKNTNLDNVIDYKGSYTPHMDMHGGIVSFDLKSINGQEKGRDIHIKVYCRSKKQQILLGQYTTYEMNRIQSGNIIFHNITDIEKPIQSGAFSFVHDSTNFNTDNIKIEFIKFLSIRSDNYNNGVYYKIETLENLKEYLSLKRDHDHLRFQRFVERIRPKVFIAAPTLLAQNTEKNVLRKMKNHLDSEFGKKLYVSFKPNSMFGSDNKQGHDWVDKDGHLLPYGDIEKLKRTRFFVLVLDDVKSLSYSYLQLGMAITMCKVVVLIGKKEQMSESIYNMRRGVITKILIKEDINIEFDRVLEELVSIMKKRLPKSYGGSIL